MSAFSNPSEMTAKKCMVIGCSSSLSNLNRWKSTSVCDMHKVVHAKCSCVLPYTLFPFPDAETDGLRRHQWIVKINRRIKKGKGKTDNGRRTRILRKPKAKYDGVCSRHFLDGNPSLLPTLNLGYNEPGIRERHVDDICNLKLGIGSTVAVESATSRQNKVKVKAGFGQVTRGMCPSQSSTDEEEMMMMMAAANEDQITPRPVAVSGSHSFNMLQLEQNLPKLKTSRKRQTNRAASLDLSDQTKRKKVRTNHEQTPATSINLDDLQQRAAVITTVASSEETDEDPLPSRPAGEGYLSIHSNSSVEDTDSSCAGTLYECSTEVEAELQFSTPILNTPRAKVKNVNETVEDMRAEIERLRNKCEFWEKEYNQLKLEQKRDPFTFLKNDKKVRHYTGFPNLATFDGFFDLLEPRAERMRFWTRHGTPAGKERARNFNAKHGPPRQLPLKSEFLMVLIRMRLGMLEETLSDLFEVSVDYVSRTCITWIKFLAIEWKCLVCQPTKEEIKLTLPKDFLGTPDVRYIIDGTELFCDSTGDLYLQAFLWSNYKHHNTVKFLVAIAPNGHISFVSKGYGGRITDKEITRVSGFYDILEYKDEVLADKGFPISVEVNEKLSTLRVPRGRRGIDQFTSEDIGQIKSVARTRVHVERAIERIKRFRILMSLPFTLIPQISDIMLVCCAIANTLPPLIAE